MKKGDKVRVYGCIIDFECTPLDYYYLRGEKAKIIAIVDSQTEIIVKFYGTPGHRLQKGKQAEVHPKQCRLVKKK